MNPSRKLSSIQDYYFARKRAEAEKLEKEKNLPFLSMAIGNPDMSPPDEVIESLIKHLKDSGAHSYQSYSGLPSFKQAISDFYHKHFNVKVDASFQILPLMGSKSGIMWLSLAYLEDGDRVFIPEPGYMAYASVTRLAGGIPVPFELNPEKNWQPDLDKLASQAENIKIMWMNYTNMPTGALADKGFLKELVAFSENFNIILAFDNPYSLISNQSISILEYADQAPVVEFQSMSKNFNMAGWRVGWVAGHQEIISNVAKVQNNVESGMFYPIQKAAETALSLSDKWFEHINSVYNNRKKKVKELIKLFDGQCSEQGGGMFCWVKLPEGVSGEKLADKLFYEYHIFIAPGKIFGKKWDNYVRISLTVPEETYDLAIERLQK